MNLLKTTLLIILFFAVNTLQAQDKAKIEPYTFKTFKKRKGGQKTVEAEMGTFMVTENRSKAHSKKIALKFVRFKSTNPNPGSPIVYLAGGPGGSGISTARGNRFELFMKMRAIADVIALDQRGTGISHKPKKFKKYWVYPMDEAMQRKKAYKIIKEFTQNTTNEWAKAGEDLAAYNSNESADDLNDLRKALGAKKISLWGISYGTHLSIATIKRHEKYLDKVILAGVEGSDHTVKLPSSSQKLLEKIDALIKADPKASKAFPDFLGDMKKLFAKVEKQPVQVATMNPLTKKPMKVTVGKYELQILFALMLTGPQYFGRLPQTIKDMHAGDFSGIKRWVLRFTHVGDLNPMSVAMDAVSGVSKKRLKQIQKESKNTLLGGAINFPYLAVTEGLGLPDLGKKFRAPLKSKLEVLCISGTLDGRTPVSNAEEVLQGLPNGKHLIIDGAGHSDPLFLSSPKIANIMLDFMKGKKVKKKQTIQLKPMKFWIKKAKTEK